MTRVEEESGQDKTILLLALRRRKTKWRYFYSNREKKTKKQSTCQNNNLFLTLKRDTQRQSFRSGSTVSSRTTSMSKYWRKTHRYFRLAPHVSLQSRAKKWTQSTCTAVIVLISKKKRKNGDKFTHKHFYVLFLFTVIYLDYRSILTVFNTVCIMYMYYTVADRVSIISP